MADRHDGEAVQGHAEHVDLPGNGEVRLVEAPRAVPGKVRVGEDHPAAVDRGLAAEP
jgi:hypothetical protein